LDTDGVLWYGFVGSHGFFKLLFFFSLNMADELEVGLGQEGASLNLEATPRCSLVYPLPLAH
jgi:hypothetical protein